MTSPIDPSQLPSSGGFSSTYYDRAARWYGLRRATARPCLRWAAGKRHRVSHLSCDGCGEPWARLTVLDHAAAWRASDGRRVVTGEPYDLTPAGLEGLRARAAAFGLAVEVLPHSPWFPGRTTALAVCVPGPSLDQPHPITEERFR